MAHGEYTDGAVYHDEQVVPILKPGPLSGVYQVADEDRTVGFNEMQQSALAEEMGLTALQEVGNILSASYLNAILE